MDRARGSDVGQVNLPYPEPGMHFTVRRVKDRALYLDGIEVPDGETVETCRLATTGEWGWKRLSTGRGLHYDGLAVWLSYNN